MGRRVPVESGLRQDGDDVVRIHDLGYVAGVPGVEHDSGDSPLFTLGIKSGPHGRPDQVLPANDQTVDVRIGRL